MLEAILKTLGLVASALNTLKAAGINVGPIGNEAITIINQSEAGKANYESGQAVVLGHFTENGKPGKIFAAADGGPAQALLGL